MACLKFVNLSGNYTEEAIERVAKAVDVSKVLKEKLNPHFTERYEFRSILKIILKH